MAMTWRARDSRGHYLASKDVHTTLGPGDWDDTCRHQADSLDLQPSSETFGHEPELEAPSPFTEQRFTYCRRCRTEGQQYDDEYGTSRRYPPSKVRWPCTSAIVLGLVPRA